MKKLFAMMILTVALAACGGKAKKPDTMENKGGDMGKGSGDMGGSGYGGATYGNPCAGTPAPM